MSEKKALIICSLVIGLLLLISIVISLICISKVNDVLSGEKQVTAENEKDEPPANETIDSAESIAESSYKLALSNEVDEKLASFYFLNAIYHNPTKVEYYNAYLDHLDNIIASPEQYIEFAQLVESVIYQFSTESVELLVPVYELIVSRYFEVENENNDNELIEKWTTGFKSFMAYAQNIEINSEEVISNYFSLSTIFNKLDNPSEEIRKQFDIVENIATLLQFHENVADSFQIINDIKDNEFMIAYDSSISYYFSVQNIFSTRNLSLEAEFSKTIKSWHEEILQVIEKIENRHDKILVDSLKSKMKILSSYTITSDNVNSVNLEYQTVLNEYSNCLASLSTNSYEQDILSCYISLSEVYTEIYKQQFLDYQIWAGRKLLEIKNGLSKPKAAEKLEFLYSSGFGEIDPSLLITQLKTAYDSLYQDSNPNKSSVPEVELISKYNSKFKGLGEI